MPRRVVDAVSMCLSHHMRWQLHPVCRLPIGKGAASG